jgi:hypothetical protein
MTDILQRAFEKASELPEHEQNAFGALFLAELESERRWDELFARSLELLEKLAAEAISEEGTRHVP